MSCRVDACELDIVAMGYCAAHYKRVKRGGDLAAPIQERLSPKQRAVEAATNLVDADSEDDAAYTRAEANFAVAVGRWRDPLVMAEKGRLGGEERAVRLSPERRKEIARMGANARAVKLGADGRRRVAVKARSAQLARARLAYRQASQRTTPRKAGNGAAEEQEP